MKQLEILLYSCLLAFALSSCSSDDDSIEGAWVLSSLELSNCDPSIESLQTESTAMGICIVAEEGRLCIETTITLNADGTSTMSNIIVEDIGGDLLEPEIDNSTGTWTKNGDTVEICDEDNDCVTMSLQGSSQLTFSESDAFFSCTVAYTFRKQ